MRPSCNLPRRGGTGRLGLEDREFQVVEALRLRGAMTFKEVGELLGVKDPAPVLRSLVESGWILSNEEMRSGPGRKVVSMVRVSERAATDEAWLGEQLDHMDARAPAQSRAMMALLDDPRNRSGVPVAELVKKRGLDAQVFKRLVDKGVVFAFKQDPWMSGAEAEDLPLADLSPAQSRAAEAIRAGMADKGLVLLEGVTGSGKTEVYTHLIHDTLAEGRDALFLVPEIALTTQLIVRLRRFFGDRLEVYHSRFTPRERTTTFRRVAQERGKGRLLVGARSAVFLPFHNLGLIVVDEEHDPSYKQQDPLPDIRPGTRRPCWAVCTGPASCWDRPRPPRSPVGG